MNYRKTTLMVIIAFLFCVSTIEAKQHKIKFQNSSEETVVYFLYRIDHNIENVSKPIAFVVGTLKPKDDWQVFRDAGGHYFLEWRSEKDELLIRVESFNLNKDISFTYSKLK